MVSLLYVVLHSLLSCLIPLANLLVIVAVYQLMRKQPGTSYVYILNLATADLLVGMMCNAEMLDDILDRDFDRSKSFCLLHIAMSMTSCVGSILTLLLISLDRYLAVTLPLSYPTLLKKMPVVLSLLVLWMLSFLFRHLPLILASLQRGNYTGYRGLLYAAKSEHLYAICFSIFAPSLLVLVCLHVSVSSIAYVQHTWLRHTCAQTGPLCAHPCRFKALWTVLIILISFSLSWGPYLVGGTVQAACSPCSLAGPLKDTLFLLGETNSLINPLIYALYSKDIRSHLTKVLRCGMKGQVKPLASNIRTVGSWGGGQTQAPSSRGVHAPSPPPVLLLWLPGPRQEGNAGRPVQQSLPTASAVELLPRGCSPHRCLR
ncbi:glucose-dependent insulinotropic receptor-like [Grus americana]|uniref:glucose-dependent insulinotropic receptor-like n=1 Tax=Grus americana TaxID=9117 RepID=UPI002407F459|nr:glucose-dependent insulinotropic receptor-like [Grus americana]